MTGERARTKLWMGWSWQLPLQEKYWMPITVLPLTQMTLFPRGDIVGLVEEDSTRSNPLILLGKVLRVNHQKRTVLLAYLQPIKGSNSKYQLDVGNNTWQEKFETLVFPVDIEFESKSYLYTLRTPKLSIHNAVKK